MTGSYVLLKLPNGSQVAYDVVDVDLEALRAAEAAQAAEAGLETATRTDRVGRYDLQRTRFEIRC